MYILRLWNTSQDHKELRHLEDSSTTINQTVNSSIDYIRFHPSSFCWKLEAAWAACGHKEWHARHSRVERDYCFTIYYSQWAFFPRIHDADEESTHEPCVNVQARLVDSNASAIFAVSCIVYVFIRLVMIEKERFCHAGISWLHGVHRAQKWAVLLFECKIGYLSPIWASLKLLSWTRAQLIDELYMCIYSIFDVRETYCTLIADPRDHFEATV
jgi:hypothetical protein